MECKSKSKSRLFVPLVLALTTSSAVAYTFYCIAGPSLLFRKIILKPIPKSVRNIRATGKRSIVFNTGHTHVLGFNIGKEDVALILDSEPFTEIEHANYSDDSGIFSFGNTSRGMTIALYQLHEDERVPEWFKLGTWDKFGAYLVEQEGLGWYRMRLLLYREDLDKAYFIEYEMNGTRQQGRDYMVLNKD